MGGKTYEFSFIPQDKDKQKSLSLLRLLETLTFAAVTKDDLPEALNQILDAVSLSCFRIGWNGHLGKPDYVEIGLEIGEINIVEDLLQIDDAIIRLRIDNPSDSATRNIYLQSYGLVEVTDADLAVSFTYGRDPIEAADQKGGKAMDLEINCLNNPLTLGSILEYWFDDTSFLFSPFDTVVKEVGMTRFKFRTGSDANGKTAVLLTHLELGLKSSRIEILGKFSVWAFNISGKFLNFGQMALRLCIPHLQSLAYYRSKRFVPNYSSETWAAYSVDYI